MKGLGSELSDRNEKQEKRIKHLEDLAADSFEEKKKLKDELYVMKNNNFARENKKLKDRIAELEKIGFKV